jgi:hypothetical protein
MSGIIQTLDGRVVLEAVYALECPRCRYHHLERGPRCDGCGSLMPVQEYVAPETPSTAGRKEDADKLRFDLVPVRALEELARVYTIGAKKYDDRNWEKGLRWGRVYAAMERHAKAWWRGERLDPVDGQHHLASVAWCALALMEYERTHPELDDRVKEPV